LRKLSGSPPIGVLLPRPAGAADELKSAPLGDRDSTWLPPRALAEVELAERVLEVDWDAARG